MNPRSPSPAPKGLFRDLVGLAHYALYGHHEAYTKISDDIVGVTTLLSEDEITQVQGQSDSNPLTVIRLLQDVLEYPGVEIEYTIDIKDPPAEDPREGKEVSINVDCAKAGVDKLKKAGAVLAGFMGAREIIKSLGNSRDREDVQYALEAASGMVNRYSEGPAAVKARKGAQSLGRG